MTTKEGRTFLVAYPHPSISAPGSQEPCSAEWPAIRHIFSVLDDAALLARLQEYRWTGRQGYSLRALWRAYVASFILNLPHTNALIRQLVHDRELREVCGFDDLLPHRTTFNRFIQRLSHHPDLVESCITTITNRLKELLPDLGQEVAIDSTVVRSHCNPSRKTVSDPQASWTVKNSARAKDGGKEWAHGYKLQLVADANHGVTLGQIVGQAKGNDFLELPRLMDHTTDLLDWFKPSAAMADRGYDSRANHQYLHDRGILPIIKMRRPTGRSTGGARLHEGIYTASGVPTCIGQVPMEYVRSDPEKGHLYRCAGCHLKDSRAGLFPHCTDEVWEDPKRDIRLFGVIRRNSPEWRSLYGKRQAIERVFKSMKESRRLERHCVRGLRQITLHSLMSVLSYQATVLVNVLAREPELMRWMVRKIE